MRIFNFKKYQKEKINTKIIGEGEVTGHMHRLQEKDNVEIYKTMEEDCLLLRVLDKPAKVTHEEHNKIDVFPNNYRVRTVREQDHINEIARRVVD